MGAVLEVRNLTTSFRINNNYYAAVDNVSLDIYPNETIAIVGESGCGKSALALALMKLHDPLHTRISGDIFFHEEKITEFSDREWNKIRGSGISIIFQDPLTALNPLMTVGKQIEENLDYHSNQSSKAKYQAVCDLLRKIGFDKPEALYKRYPHELSGGMRQRIVISIAMINNPSVIIADEPTTALDVTIQAQILELLRQIKIEYDSSIILITHDLGVVAEMADRVAVMYAGEIVELAPVAELFDDPKHPYTRSLFNSMPQVAEKEANLHVIEGVVPALQDIDRKHCRFAPRIPWIDAEAHEENPELHELSEGHFVRCTCWKHFHFRTENEQKEGL